ncbi:MAG: DUF368 domain-containing protein [Bacilli bacterium]|nr:DUF368 domain-containing protein [Bacilli bacterium]
MNFFTGFLIGVVSLIPGISGGTVLVLMKKFNYLTEIITNFKDKKNKMILFRVILGIFLGAITFSRIIELLFYFIPNETLIFFSGLVLFQVPYLIKENKIKLQKNFFLLGLIIIFALNFIPVESTKVITEFPKINLIFLILFMFSGTIDGFFTIIPGISGSLIMMILGPYYLYKSFLAHLSIKTFYFILPLFFYFIGDLLGFYFGSKVSHHFLKKAPNAFMNLILGMVIGSIIVLIPTPILKTLPLLKYSLALTLSYLSIYLINKIS